MSKLRSFLLLFAFFVSAASLPAAAQDEYEGEISGNARMDVRLAQFEEQLRRMEGTIERLSYENRQLKNQMEKANADTQYRLQALENKQSGAAPAASSSPPPADSDQMQPVVPSSGSDTFDNAPAAPAAAEQRFANSRDHYNYAFKLMNQAKYPEAGNSFAAFTKRYPRDPLIGNAFYWLGETYYVRRDYTRAADYFRQGYEALPTGPKAADNLLKLAMSLNAMKKDTEACVVLKQVVIKFGTGSVKSRAEQEMNRIGCN